MQIEYVIQVFSVLAVSAAGVVALFQWHSSSRLTGAKAIYDLTNKVRGDEDLRVAWYFLEHNSGNVWCDDRFYRSDLGEKMDHLLSHLTYAVHLLRSKVIKENEFKLLDYQIRAVSQNEGMQVYIYNLYRWAENGNRCGLEQRSSGPSERGRVRFSFQALFEYGLEKGYLPEKITNTERDDVYPLAYFNRGDMPPGSSPHVAGWFFRVSKDDYRWVAVTMRDGKRYYGYFSGMSLVWDAAAGSDIYLEDVRTASDKGEWVRIPGVVCIMLSRAHIISAEFFSVDINASDDLCPLPQTAKVCPDHAQY
jgi:hypothetical protein